MPNTIDDDFGIIGSDDQSHPAAGYDILGAALSQSPAFQQLLAKRAMLVPVRSPGHMPSAIEQGLTTENIDALLDREPALDEYITKQLPPAQRVGGLGKARDTSLPFGPTHGKAGSVQTLSTNPQGYFRGEKLIATDTAPNPGTGTYITGLYVGSKAQFSSGNKLTTFFSNNALGSGMRLDTCQPPLSIMLSVSFIQDCTFSAELFGKIVI
jgi:hypothetical protein